MNKYIVYKQYLHFIYYYEKQDACYNLKNDYDLIGRSLEDVIIEPVRSMLIPGFDEVKKCSVEAGALGGGISGSGPSIFMLSQHENTAKQVEQLMIGIYAKLGIDFRTYVTTINYGGVKII